MGLLNKKNIDKIESNKFGIRGLKKRDLETGDLAVLEDNYTKENDIDSIGVIVLKKDIIDLIGFTNFRESFCGVPEDTIGYIMFPGENLKYPIWSYIRLTGYEDDLKYKEYGGYNFSITSVIKHAISKKDVFDPLKCVDVVKKYREAYK